MNGSQALLQALEEEDVRYIFGIPGGANLPLYDAVGRQEIKHIHALHEQGAGHMATGYAKASGKVGVAFATSGPGATNLVTPIADAYMDSAPVLFVTGQVRSDLLGTDAFQEADIMGITLPIVKHSFALRSPEEVRGTVRAAFEIARSGRPGPVLLDIPQDVLRGDILKKEITEDLRGYRPPDGVHGPTIDRILEAIGHSQKPVIYAGGGTLDASRELRRFAEATGIPVTCTLMGLGAYPADEDLWMGMLGMHGSRAANWAIDQCDLLLAFGARFDDRITGRLQDFASNAQIVHIDIDPAEIHKIVPASIALRADLREALQILGDQVQEQPDRQNWIDQIETWKKEYPFSYKKSPERIKPQNLVQILAEETSGEALVSSDVGQHQMWVAQYYPFREPRQWINSGGSGTMGVGLPYAIGAALANPERPSVLVTGDGSLPMTSQEMHVLSRYNIPVKIFLVANGGYGMVRQWQDLFWDRARNAVELGSWPDWPAMAEAWGIRGDRVENPEKLQEAVRATLAHDGPALLEVCSDPEENCWPMIPAGAAARDMIDGSESP